MKNKCFKAEKRYKHKLNMLEPGTKMLKWTGLLLAAGVLFGLLHWKYAAYCVMGLAGCLFAVLIILLMIESHQDRVLNETAIKEDRNDKTGDRYPDRYRELQR